MLKLFALLFMVIDHLGFVFFPEMEALRMVGRLSMPLFAYAVGRGSFYTHDKKRYLIQLSLMALVSQGPFMLMADTHALSMMVPWLLGVVVTVLPPAYGTLLLLGASLLPMDYTVVAALLPLVVYLWRYRKPSPVLFYGSFTLILGVIAFLEGGLQWWSLLAVPLIPLLEKYDSRVKLNKWLFYWFYPLHMLLFWGLKLVLP